MSNKKLIMQEKIIEFGTTHKVRVEKAMKEAIIVTGLDINEGFVLMGHDMTALPKEGEEGKIVFERGGPKGGYWKYYPDGITKWMFDHNEKIFITVYMPKSADDFKVTTDGIVLTNNLSQVKVILLNQQLGAYEKVATLNNISKEQAAEMVHQWATNIPDSYLNYLWPIGPHYYSDPIKSLTSRLQDNYKQEGGNYAILKLIK